MRRWARDLCRSWLLTALAVLVCSACNQDLDLLSSSTTEPEAAESPPRDAGMPSVCANCAEGTVCAADGCKALPTISAIAAGSEHTCRVTNAALSCWGANAFGQLGLGDTVNYRQPQRVRGTPWLTVAAGAHHTCGLRTPGFLYCWGDNSQGQLGVVVNNTNPSGGMGTGMNPQQRGTRMFRVSENIENFTQLKCGGDNCCALRTTGELYCWGANAEGSAGIGRTNNMPVMTPMQVKPGSLFLRSFSVGAAHSCAIRSDRSLWCWGRNRSGQLGQGSSRAPQAAPVQVGTSKDWTSVAAGAEHTCGIGFGKTLYCWGANDDAQLGVARLGPDGMPVVVDSPNPVDVTTKWASIAAGGFHTCGIQVSGELRCWGHGSDGQLGLGKGDDEETPQLVTSPEAVSQQVTWKELALGGAYSCGFDSGGRLYCWGNNSQGQLGLGDTFARDEPAALPAP